MSPQKTIRMTDEEVEMAEKLALYLHKLGKIEKPTLSDAMRQCLHYVVGDVLKGIEAERYAR